MLYALLFLLLAFAIYAPQFWVRYVLRKHSKPLDGMPGTGSELALHLVERFELEGVTVQEVGEDENYYSPSQKIIGLSPDVYHGKSLSAVATAAHEVGHAIQYHRKEPISQLRGRYAARAHLVQNLGICILACVPVAGFALRSPALSGFLLAIGVLSMLASVVFHALILPEEYDASYNKALPILAEGYVPETYMPAIRQVLKACALTYVAAALADVLSIWRWLAILR